MTYLSLFITIFIEIMKFANFIKYIHNLQKINFN